MKYDRQELISLIERLINNEPCLREWDDLVSVKHEDKFTEYWASELLNIQEAYSDRRSGRLINDEGVSKLSGILSRLKGIESNQGS
jgi:hypothetical protein